MIRLTAARLVRAAAALAKPLDGGVLRALRAEIDLELSLGLPQPPSASLEATVKGFAVEWDDAKSRDVVLRKRRGEGGEEEEEVVVSALLGPVVWKGERLMPGNAFAKVCVRNKKEKVRGEAGADAVDDVWSILQFDCEMRERGGGDGGSDLFVRRVSRLSSSGDDVGDVLLRLPPIRRHTSGKLQGAFQEYLAARGLDTKFTGYLIEHLREKERQQYIDWLQMVEAAIS